MLANDDRNSIKWKRRCDGSSSDIMIWVVKVETKIMGNATKDKTFCVFIETKALPNRSMVVQRIMWNA